MQSNGKFVVDWNKFCRLLNLVDVLAVSAKESEVQVSNNEIEVMPCISLNSVSAGNFRLNLFKNISHHLNSFVSNNSPSCQMAINKTKSVLIQSELDAHSTFVANIASKAQRDCILVTTVQVANVSFFNKDTEHKFPHLCVLYLDEVKVFQILLD